MIINNRMEHLPRPNDVVRLGGEGAERYLRVTELIWCLDEHTFEGQRVNIRLEEDHETT
jgi:hypothetical protein